MKKYIIFAAALFMVAMACQKESTSPTSQAANTVLALESSFPPPQNVDGRLVFASEEHFLGIINALDHGHANLNTWEDDLNFTSVRRVNESLYESGDFELLPFADKYFATVLNARCVIQVGDWVFKLHPAIRKVLALHISNIGKFPVLDDDTIIPDSDIKVFDFDDDVFGILEEMATPTNPNPPVASLFCKEGCTSSVNGPANITSWTAYCTPNPSVTTETPKRKSILKHDGFGIIKCIFVEWCHKFKYDGPSGVTYFDECDQPVNIIFNVKAKPKCKTEESSSVVMSDILDSSGELLTTHSGFADDDGECWNLYRGTRCLRSFTASATVVWRDACTKANNTTGRTYTLTMDNLGTISGN